jgi:hypothetical protein
VGADGWADKAAPNTIDDCHMIKPIKDKAPKTDPTITAM